MKMTVVKRLAVLALGAAITVSFFGCSGKGAGKNGDDGSGKGASDSTASVLDKNVIYKEQVLDLSKTPYSMRNVSEAVTVGDKLYLLGMFRSGDDIESEYGDDNGDGTESEAENGTEADTKSEAENVNEADTEEKTDDDTETEAAASEVFKICMDLKGNYESHTSFPIDEDGYVDCFAMDEDRNVYLVIGKTVYPETSDTKEGNEDMDGYEESYYIRKYDEEGKLLFDVELDTSELKNGSGHFNIQNMYYIKDHGVLLVDNGGLALYSDKDGSFISRPYDEDHGRFFINSKSEVYTTSYDMDGVSIIKIDLDDKKEDEKISIPMSIRNFARNFYAAKSYDFIVEDGDGFSSWNVGDEELKKLISFIDSDLNIEDADDIIQLSDTSVLVSYYADDYGRTYSVLNKVDPDTVADKEVITLGVNYTNIELRNMIVSFNKKSEKYRIKLIDYSKFTTEDDWAGSDKLSSDILSGNSPDIISLDAIYDLYNYEAKGLFEPLDSYIANDEELSKKEFFTQVLDAYKYKGTSYVIMPTFTLPCFAMKKSLYDKVESWDLDSMDKLIKESGAPYETALGAPLDRVQFFEMAMVFGLKDYVDVENGKANFDSEQFIKMLELAKEFPKEVDYEKYYSQDHSDIFRTGKAITKQTFLYNFEEFAEMRYAEFGEDIVLLGYPGEEGKAHYGMVGDAVMAMSASSEHKEACWEFLRTFLTGEYQKLIYEQGFYMGFPTGKEEFDKFVKKAMTPNKKYEHYTKVAGEEVKIPELKQEDIDVVMDYINQVDSVLGYDKTLMNIVLEESEPFFKEQKTAQECAHIIQSKAQIYLDESLQ